MAQAFASIEIPIPPDEIWRLIGGFGSLPDWLPFIPKSELREGGRVRHLVDPDGQSIFEQLEKFDNQGRSYSYSILQASFPVTAYLSTLRVQQAEQGNGSKVDWFGHFAPKGVSEEDASRLFQGIYEEGLKALAGRFTSVKQQVNSSEEKRN